MDCQHKMGNEKMVSTIEICAGCGKPKTHITIEDLQAQLADREERLALWRKWGSLLHLIEHKHGKGKEFSEVAVALKAKGEL